MFSIEAEPEVYSSGAEIYKELKIFSSKDKKRKAIRQRKS